MSMILEALKQAERERHQREQPDSVAPAQAENEAAPAVAAAQPTPPQDTKRRWLLLLIAALIFLLAIWALRPWWAAPEPGASTSPPANNVARPDSAAPPADVPAPSAPPPASLTTSDASKTVPDTPSVPTDASAGTASTGPAITDPASIDVAELYRSPQTRAPEPTAAEALYENQSSAEAVEPVAAALSDTDAVALSDKEPIAEPVLPTEEPPAVPAIITIRDLSWGLQQRIPSLNYQAHTYRENGQSRVRINHRERQAGEQLAPGLRIERIEPDGTILSFEGETFKLPALNSWVNM